MNRGSGQTSQVISKRLLHDIDHRGTLVKQHTPRWSRCVRIPGSQPGGQGVRIPYAVRSEDDPVDCPQYSGDADLGQHPRGGSQQGNPSQHGPHNHIWRIGLVWSRTPPSQGGEHGFKSRMRYGGVAQMVAQSPHKGKVAGSSPAIATRHEVNSKERTSWKSSTRSKATTDSSQTSGSSTITSTTEMRPTQPSNTSS